MKKLLLIILAWIKLLFINKEEKMSRKYSVGENLVSDLLDSPPAVPVETFPAVGLFFNKTARQWELVTVEFTENGKTSIKDRKMTGTDKAEAIERFKILVADKVIYKVLS